MFCYKVAKWRLACCIKCYDSVGIFLNPLHMLGYGWESNILNYRASMYGFITFPKINQNIFMQTTYYVINICRLITTFYHYQTPCILSVFALVQAAYNISF